MVVVGGGMWWWVVVGDGWCWVLGGGGGGRPLEAREASSRAETSFRVGNLVLYQHRQDH